MSRDESEVKRLIEMLGEQKSIPTFLNLPDYVEFADKIDKTISFIKETNSPRLIVLDTWLIIDFSIRHILKFGLEINKFCDENFDSLPQGFRDCSNLLENFIKKQKDKQPNPSKKMILLPYEFKMAIIEDEDFLKKFIKHEAEYYKKVDFSGYWTIDDLQDSKYRNVDENWLKLVEKLDAEWFKKAEKLNRVRNKAAHSFDENKIYQEIGLNGDRKLEELKKSCINTLNDLIGLKYNVQRPTGANLLNRETANESIAH